MKNVVILCSFSVNFILKKHLSCHTIFILAILVPGLSYSPTSSVFINVPSISKLQWHPFSITSSSKMDLDKLSVVIKSNGSWSQKMYQMLSSSPSPMDRMEVSIEGPYGPPSTHFLKVCVFFFFFLFSFLKKDNFLSVLNSKTHCGHVWCSMTC